MQRSPHEASDGRHGCRAAGHQAIKVSGFLRPPASQTYSDLSVVSNMLAHCGINANGGRRYRKQRRRSSSGKCNE